MAERIGNPKTEKERLRETSPLLHVDQIQAPVLLAYGELDQRVPIANGKFHGVIA